eukprot:6208257-Pleurochrysis_carterae.AAC.1
MPVDGGLFVHHTLQYFKIDSHMRMNHPFCDAAQRALQYALAQSSLWEIDQMKRRVAMLNGVCMPLLLG